MDAGAILGGLRDLAIIFLALVNAAIGLAILIILWQVLRLMRLARQRLPEVTSTASGLISQVREVADTANQTARQAKGSAEFVSDQVVYPLISLLSAVAGATRFAEALVRPPPRPAADEESRGEESRRSA